MPAATTAEVAADQSFPSTAIPSGGTGSFFPRPVVSIIAVLGTLLMALAWYTAADAAKRREPAAQASARELPEVNQAVVARTAVARTAVTVLQAATEMPRISAPGAATSSGLRINSNPAGARVTVNGIGWGETPVTIRYLPAGSKLVRITKDGYATAQRTIDLAAPSASKSLTVNLRPQAGADIQIARAIRRPPRRAE
jgi:hypothetical protein